MSVKLSNSLEPFEKKSKQTNFNKKILTNTKESYLKFVIGDDFLTNAIVEIKEIIKDIPSCEIFLMPLGDTAEILIGTL